MMFVNIAQKRCPRCGETKEIAEFPRDRKTKDGHGGWCKVCCNKKSNSDYHTDPKRRQYIIDAASQRYFRLKEERPGFKEKHRQEAKEWRENNPVEDRRNLIRCQDKNRALKFGTEGSYSIQEMIELENDYCGRCAYCGTKERNGFDHIVPLSGGGTNFIDNMVPCCDSCNKSKRATPLILWMWKKLDKDDR